MRVGDFVYILFLAGIALFLVFDETRSLFEEVTKTLPHIMGFIKFFILATSGELLTRRISSGKWHFKGINLFSRAFIWGIIGLMVTYIFVIFGAGIELLVSKNMLPIYPTGIFRNITKAFWMSLFTNIFFGFEMMIFHRFTDTLIDDGNLWKRWPVVETWRKIDWKNIFGFVFPSLFWFWLPMHTITFSLPEDYRVLMAAALGIALGIILSIAKNLSKKDDNNTSENDNN